MRVNAGEEDAAVAAITMMHCWVDALHLLRQAQVLFVMARAHPTFEIMLGRFSEETRDRWLWWEEELDRVEPTVVNTIETIRANGQHVPAPTLPDAPDVGPDHLDDIVEAQQTALGGMQKRLAFAHHIFETYTER